VKAVIDLALCQGHGQCQEAAPNVFEVRDDGYAYLLVDAIPAAEEANARDGASRCPTEAIDITD
jgi:ferredoxin